MNDTYTKAQFWKCALQVNSYDYIKLRGAGHGMTEDEYNRQLLDNCLEGNIKVVGIANHLKVDSIDAIRTLMNEHDVVVFPGFEITTSEKVHFVCLFSETTTIIELNSYLGALGITDVNDKTSPTAKSAGQLLAKVEELGGVVYAAHCTDDNGVLQKKLNHVWKDPLLKAAQIPGALDDLKTEDGNGYRQILLNKNPDYKRKTPIAVLNAKDVERPETLKDPRASCLIKMTRPCFESFKQAFLDPESRVRLNSDVQGKYYSRIEKVSFTGGYLDGVSIDFSENLNTIIGGRGTGKSTLLECIRYGLKLNPIGKNAQRQHDEIVKENLGKEKGRVEIVLRSSKMNGNRFTISRKYGESPYVKDENGQISSFIPPDLMPRIEIYGQNEIYEIAQDTTGQLNLLNRFIDVDSRQMDSRLEEITKKLAENRAAIEKVQGNIAEIEDEVARLPKLQEQISHFKKLGLDDKLEMIPLYEKEKQLAERIVEEVSQLSDSLAAFKGNLPDTVFLSDNALEGLPHAEILKPAKSTLDKLKQEIEPFINKIDNAIRETGQAVEQINHALILDINSEDEKLTKAFKEIPSYEGRSGKEIGEEFKKLLQEIERIRPMETSKKNKDLFLAEYKKTRQAYLDELSEIRADRSAQLQRVLKSLNKKLDGKLKLTVSPEANRKPIVEFLMRCSLDGVGPKRLNWIEESQDFSPVKLAGLIREGSEALQKTGWGITPTVAEALTKLSESQVMQLEELELQDNICIELNVAHEGAENYRPLNKLSTGQQCTAILHVLLLENKDPLIMDQPEDNLDNAFIADRIVTEIRSAKIGRQFIFATHNANIPVFGDAEWIGVFNANDGQASLPPDAQGAIDLPGIQKKAAEILEGGELAFIQRKDKYGF
jgi:ABC-type lipoprotein export system ATPase subunit